MLLSTYLQSNLFLSVVRHWTTTTASAAAAAAAAAEAKLQDVARHVHQKSGELDSSLAISLDIRSLSPQSKGSGMDRD